MLAEVFGAHRDYSSSELRPQQWLLVEWPQDDAEPIKYFLSTLPADTSIQELVRVAKLRWRIERDYQELKQEFGLDHFEGRSWRGFHHHATLSIAAYGFLLAERFAYPKKNSATSRSGRNPCLTRRLPAAPFPCDASATSRIRSQHYASNWQQR
jgi:SRSO17 transposase